VLITARVCLCYSFKKAPEDKVNAFLDQLYYFSGQYDSAESFAGLDKVIKEKEQKSESKVRLFASFLGRCTITLAHLSLVIACPPEPRWATGSSTWRSLPRSSWMPPRLSSLRP
jgi:hypothetical protein